MKNTQSKHTDGPWSYEFDDAKFKVIDSNLLPVAFINSDQTRDRGNALLIHAAPDLLMACKIVMCGTEWMTKQDFEFIKNAIAKAEGNNI